MAKIVAVLIIVIFITKEVHSSDLFSLNLDTISDNNPTTVVTIAQEDFHSPRLNTRFYNRQYSHNPDILNWNTPINRKLLKKQDFDDSNFQRFQYFSNSNHKVIENKFVPINQLPDTLGNRKNSDVFKFESSSGDFVQRHPRLDENQKKTNNKIIIGTNIQKITKTNESRNQDSRVRINQILKGYLAKLYDKKFSKPTTDFLQNDSNLKKTQNGDVSENLEVDGQKSKLFDGNTLWEIKDKIKNKTLGFKQLFSLFTIVKFNDSECQATSSSGTYSGVCYHETVCSNMNGMAVGNCADGYGVCCVCEYLP